MEDKNRKKCPYCGANIPLLAKVCSYCHRELPQDNVDKEYIKRGITGNIADVEEMETLTTLGLSLKFFSVTSVLIFLLSLLYFFFYFKMFAAFNIVLMPLFFLIIFLVYKVPAKNRKLPQNIKARLKELKASNLQYQNLAKIYFPGDPAITLLINDFNKKVYKLEKELAAKVKGAYVLNVIYFLLFNIYVLSPADYKVKNKDIYPEAVVFSSGLNDMSMADIDVTFERHHGDNVNRLVLKFPVKSATDLTTGALMLKVQDIDSRPPDSFVVFYSGKDKYEFPAGKKRNIDFEAVFDSEQQLDSAYRQIKRSEVFYVLPAD